MCEKLLCVGMATMEYTHDRLTIYGTEAYMYLSI